MMKIVTLSTYRVNNPMHGGQIRLNAIHNEFRKNGCIVKHVSIHTGNIENLDDDEISYPLSIDDQIFIEKKHLRQDVHACIGFLTDKTKYRDFEARMDEFKPDIFWLEQPWAWPLVKEYIARNKLPSVVIYGSQNVEQDLISSVSGTLSASHVDRITKVVSNLEEDLCRNCDGIVAVSQSDLDQFQRFGKATILAKNGVWPKLEFGGLDYWSNALKYSNFALFVGSAHPPNAEGFVNMLGRDLSFMAPNEKVIVVGGVCHLLKNNKAYRLNKGLVMPRMMLLEGQDNSGLATFFKLSKAIILPITSGGGTNLKTAEALYSRKPIVATSRAFRGYEEYVNYPNVCINDDPAEFRRSLQDVLSRPEQPFQFSEVEQHGLDRLLWTGVLGEVVTWLTQVRNSVDRLGGSSGRSRDLFWYDDWKAAAGQPTNPASTAANDSKGSIFSDAPEVEILPDGAKFISLDGFNLQPCLHSGWHTFEANGTWSKDRVATLKIKPPFEHQDLQVHMDVEVYMPKNDSNAIDVYSASSHYVSKVCNFRSRNSTLTFSVNSSDFNRNGELEIYIQVQKLFSPRSVSNSVDFRMIGCRVKNVVVRDTVETTKPADRNLSRIKSNIMNIVKNRI